LKYYVISGEASGDLHGSNLIKELKKIDKSANFRCWGGDLIKKETGFLVKHFKDYSYMGFFEVFLNIFKILKNLSFCKKDILNYKPDLIIYIDFPGFNLRIAKWAKKKMYKNHFYISPQIWAWKQSRIKTIKNVIDQMYVILPFEMNFYKSFEYDVNYVGHPLLDALKENLSNKKRENIIALLPGSREQEINKILPKMLSVIGFFKEYKFIICGAPSFQKKYYENFIEKKFKSRVSVVENKTYEILKESKAALVASGTATLEAAILNVPQVVCYESSWISYLIGKTLIKNLKFISLVNLILNKHVVKELIQSELTKKNIINELSYILSKEGDKQIKSNYIKMRNILGKKGASNRAAKLIYNYSNS
jgi:lipid-A-disaccharide synthase|tara:strand:- start:103 stop:1197 length:1095 start_codon:yes stop_codon:yes gene_type:complete